MIKILLVLVVLHVPAFSQQSKLSKAVNYLSEFIASDYYKQLEKTNNSLSLVDTIYLRAVRYKNYDYSEALLALTFATIPYNVVPIRLLPFVNITIDYPIITDSESIFLAKNRNLPSRLYYDTPTNDFGDKDKLAHLFGAAFISYTSYLFDFTNLIGYFVEVFEQTFEVQNSVDRRDLDTDKLGDLFGKVLRNSKKVLPSDIFLTYSLFNIRYTP